MRRPTLREAGPIFDRLLTEIDAPVMSREAAVRVLGAAIARSVFSGDLAPRVAADKLGALWLELGQPESLDGFWALADEYECLPDDHAAIDQDVTQHLQGLLGDTI